MYNVNLNVKINCYEIRVNRIKYESMSIIDLFSNIICRLDHSNLPNSNRTSKS